MSAVAFGLLLFGATEFRDMRKSAQEREAAKENSLRQEKEIAQLENLLSVQKELAATSKKLAGTQDQVIETQSRQTQRLRDVLLSTYQLSGVEISIRPIEYAFKQFTTALKEVQAEYVRTGASIPKPLQYFEPCLMSGQLEARRGERDQWLLDCVLGRPQGFINLRFYCAPETFEWRAFEGVLSVLLGRRFKVMLGDGTELVNLSDLSRPNVVVREGRTLKVTLQGHRVKLSQLIDTKLRFSMERTTVDLKSMPESLRLRSLDPLIQFDHTFTTAWSLEKVGTRKAAMEPGDEPFDEDIRIPMAGPFPLLVKIDRRFADAARGENLP